MQALETFTVEQQSNFTTDLAESTLTLNTTIAALQTQLDGVSALAQSQATNLSAAQDRIQVVHRLLFPRA